jgi:hypothetical protein
MAAEEQEVIFSNHGNRLEPILKNYQKWFNTDEAGAIESLMSDLFLRLDDMGLDECDIIDQAATRRDRVRAHAPDEESCEEGDSQ